MSGLLAAHRAVLESSLSVTEKLVLLALLNHWSEASPEPYPSVETLSALASVDVRTVRRALKSLSEKGVLVVRRNAGPAPKYPNVYDLGPVFRGELPRAQCHPGHDVTPGTVSGVTGCQPGHDVHGPLTPCPQTPGTVPAKEIQEEIQEEIQAPPELSLEFDSKRDDAREHSDRQNADRVFDHWLAAMGKDRRRTKFTPQRRKKIQARMREGYTADDLCAAIDGCKASPFHMGENDRGEAFNDLETIFGSGGKVESHIQRLGRPRGRVVVLRGERREATEPRGPAYREFVG